MSAERRIVLMRHGIADPPESMPDEERALTVTGRRRMAEIARGLRRLIAEIDVIYTSPLTRCRQSAAYLAKRYDVAFTIAEELAPGGAARDVIELIARTDGSTIACVGHEPNLSAAMLELTRMSAGQPPMLKKGGCYILRMTETDVRLESLLGPKVLRKV